MIVPFIRALINSQRDNEYYTLSDLLDDTELLFWPKLSVTECKYKHRCLCGFAREELNWKSVAVQFPGYLMMIGVTPYLIMSNCAHKLIKFKDQK